MNNNWNDDYTEYKYYTTYVDPNFEKKGSGGGGGGGNGNGGCFWLAVVAFLMIYGVVSAFLE